MRFKERLKTSTSSMSQRAGRRFNKTSLTLPLAFAPSAEPEAPQLGEPSIESEIDNLFKDIVVE
jgi:hypothetical protein